MSDESVVHGIIDANRFREWAETFNSGSVGNNSNPLVREVKAHFNSEGVTVRAVDAANVAMFDETVLSASAFEAYAANGSATIGLSLERFIDRLKPAGSDDLVEFDINMETRHLEIGYGATDLSIALIDPDAMRNEPDSPDLGLPNKVVLEAERLSHAVDVADMIGDHVTIRCQPDERCVEFYARGDTDDATVTYGDEEVVDADVPQETESIYSVDYMGAFTEAMPTDADVRLRLGDEFPLRMDWSTFEGSFDVHATLAPRIQSD